MSVRFSFEITNRSGARVPRAKLTAALQSFPKLFKRYKALGQDLLTHEFYFYFISAGEMKKLNHQFRGKNRPTDVLTFPGEFHEIFICPEVIREQARDHGLTIFEETLYMCLHGVLHAIGYDHERGREDEKEMFDLQDKVFAELRS